MCHFKVNLGHFTAFSVYIPFYYTPFFIIFGKNVSTPIRFACRILYSPAQNAVFFARCVSLEPVEDAPGSQTASGKDLAHDETTIANKF